MLLTMGPRVLPGELTSCGRSIQAGNLCYINGCAVDLVARLDASSSPRDQRLCLVRASCGEADFQGQNSRFTYVAPLRGKVRSPKAGASARIGSVNIDLPMASQQNRLPIL